MGDDLVNQALEWIRSTTGAPVSEGFQEGLKDGQVLLNMANKIRPGTFTKISTYKAAFRCMQNLDQFVKFCKALGVEDQDCFKAEDMFYGNNLPRCALTLLSLSNKAAEAGMPVQAVSFDVEAARETVAASQKDGKMRSIDSGLGMLEANASKKQKEISGAFRQGDKISGGSKEKAVASADLGMLDANASASQKMVSESKRSTDKISSGSKEKSVGSSELGMLDANASASQKMVSESKRSTDKISSGSKEKSVGSSELGMLEANASASQKMVSEAKRDGTDKIIRSTEQAVATSELGMLDANASAQQQTISDARGSKLDNIIRSGGDLE